MIRAPRPAWLVILAALAACGGAAHTCPAAAAAPADAAPLLWRVRRAGGDGPTLWLFGTVHHLSLGGVPPPVLRALDGATTFASELGDVEPDPDSMRTYARLPRGKGLDQRLPMNDWFDLRDLLRPSIKEADLARARPWLAMSLMTSQLSNAPKPSMDFALAERARDRGIPVEPLETWEAQLAVIDATVDDHDLLEALRARHTMRCDLGRIRDVYLAGDADTLDRLLRGKNATALLTDRNRAWMPQLERYLAAGGAFVAVGVAHLTNAGDGLPAMFTAAGYDVQRMAP